MAEFVIEERQVADITVLVLGGKMTIGAGSVFFLNTIRRLLGEGKIKILLDLSDVRYIDNAGIGELAISYTVISKENGQLKLYGLTTKIEDLLAITKLLVVFDSYSVYEEALSSFE